MSLEMYDRTKKYLLACSFGPDSMALFDMLLKRGFNLTVVHVNYHKRGEESDSEERRLREFCKEHDVPIEVLDVRTVPEQTGNFQAWAREVRYKFFQKVYDKVGAAAIFVAHHQDDVIETYFIQKYRKTHVLYYGINEISKVMGMTVLRPLLSYSKNDLHQYCLENQIPFSNDSSNFADKYLRNKIRHDLVSKMTDLERKNILDEIKQENDVKARFYKDFDDKMKIEDSLEIREIIALEPEEFAESLYRLISSVTPHVNLSKKRIEEIRKVCLAEQPNISLDLGHGYRLVKEYDVLKVAEYHENQEGYNYVLEKPGKLDTPYFTLNFAGDATDRNIEVEDYPITIRSALPKDKYLVGGNMCEVRRLYIDWKMPAQLRKTWPVITDKHGIIIYVPRYRKDYVEVRKSTFKIK